MGSIGFLFGPLNTRNDSVHNNFDLGTIMYVGEFTLFPFYIKKYVPSQNTSSPYRLVIGDMHNKLIQWINAFLLK